MGNNSICPSPGSVNAKLVESKSGNRPHFVTVKAKHEVIQVILNVPCSSVLRSAAKRVYILLSVIVDLTLSTSMFWLTAVGQSNCGPPVPCALTLGAFCLLKWLSLAANSRFAF